MTTKEEIKNELKKDLGIIVKTPNEIFWSNIVDKCNDTIKILEDELKLNIAIKSMAESNLSKPKDI